MSKQVNFRPELKKATSKGNGVTEVLLIVNNGSLVGKKDALDSLLGKTVSVTIQPETVEFSLPVNKQTKQPNIKYIVNNDGTVEVSKEEQTSLDVGDGVEEVENQTIQISKDLVDEFITKATSLSLPEDITINPRDVITRINDGEDLGEIAESYEMSDTALINQIEAARQYFAPFANEWDKKRDEVVFSDPEPEEKEDESAEDAEGETETEESVTESDHLETESPDIDQSLPSNDEEVPGINAEADGDLLGKSDPYGNEPPENDDSESDNQTDDEDPEDDPYK